MALELGIGHTQGFFLRFAEDTMLGFKIVKDIQAAGLMSSACVERGFPMQRQGVGNVMKFGGRGGCKPPRG